MHKSKHFKRQTGCAQFVMWDDLACGSLCHLMYQVKCFGTGLSLSRFLHVDNIPDEFQLGTFFILWSLKPRLDNDLCRQSESIGVLVLKEEFWIFPLAVNIQEKKKKKSSSEQISWLGPRGRSNQCLRCLHFFIFVVNSRPFCRNVPHGGPDI